MRLLFTVAITFCMLVAQTQPKRILWIGNSYTTVNNLPLLFHDLALSSGDTVIYDSNALGGYTFQQHTLNTATI